MSQDCSEKKCPNGTVCVEKKGSGGAIFANCLVSSSSSTPAPTSPSSATPSASCNGVIDKGLCYDPLCLPARRQSRLQIMLKMKCKSKPGYTCVKEEKSVRCVDKETSPPTASAVTTTSSATVTMATASTGSTTSSSSTSDNPTAEPILCNNDNDDHYDDDDDKDDDDDDKDDDDEKDDGNDDKDDDDDDKDDYDDDKDDNYKSKNVTLKCSKRFVNNKGKCVHKKCVAKRRNGIRKCEKDGKFYCMKDDLGRIDCRACVGLEENGICTVSECVKPNTTNPVTKCKELGGVCRKVRRVVTCIQDDDRRPGNKSHRSKCVPKVDGRKGNKTDDDMEGGRNKTDERHDNKGDRNNGKGDHKDDKDDGKGDHKDDKDDGKGDRKDDKDDDKDGRDDDKDDDDKEDDNDDDNDSNDDNDDKKRRRKN